MIDWPLDPARTALINVDLQNVFVEGFDISATDGPEVVQRLNKLSRVCRDHGMMVIHTINEIRADGSNRGVASEVVTAYLQSTGTSRKGGISAGSDGAKLHDSLEVEPSDVLLSKPRYGSFTGTDLDLILRTNNIEAVIIGGIATNVCCDTTAREANQRDYKVFFLSDGTGNHGMQGLSAEVIKDATLAAVRLAFGQVLTVDETIAKIKGGGQENVAAE
ncbi:MAG: cysteine hydrolase [Rhodospirillaceae bacterium]|nr:cysteine hydrolase [Rhodospirillaceae bacterium]